MSISVNPVLPVIAASGAAPDLLLQPGSLVDAQVLKILSDNLVRIAIAGLSIDVLSEIQLFPGQSLQLAVSQTPAGIRLTVAGPDTAGAPGTAQTITPAAPNAVAGTQANSPSIVELAQNILTPLEEAAVATAAETAATRQDSQAPLFANLGVAASSGGLPPKLQQAIIQVLAQRPSLDLSLTGSDIKSAFQKSGLFLEASLASGSVASSAGIPDLKAALIVLRQTLFSTLSTTGLAQVPAARSPSAPAEVLAASAATGVPDIPAIDAAASQNTSETSTLAPSLPSDLNVAEILLPRARVSVAAVVLEAGGEGRLVLSATPGNAAGPRAAVSVDQLNLLREMPTAAENASVATALSLNIGRHDDVTVHTNTPPPPFRGALPSAQPVASPSIASSAPLATTVHRLLGETDAAIARQTLLQVASLPDRVDNPVPIDSAASRWNFEIPFAMPSGTAMAQFEISRDGGGKEVQASKRVWRARFSLDVEPAGPIHALVSLVGERTSVRMWAERPATAAQLRAAVAQLSQALSKAELQPGEIVIREGVPSQPAAARAGHFVDRAL